MTANLDVLVRVENLHCIEPRDWDSDAEPNVWVVFFKVDGEKCIVSGGGLVGTATVDVRPGFRHTLAPGAAGGDDRRVPALQGEFRTTLRPVPVRPWVPGSAAGVDGVLGCAVIVWEQDFSADTAIKAGHEVLGDEVQKELDELIPTLTVLHPRPTQEEIDAIVDRISAAVQAAIKRHLTLDPLGFFQDDKVGTAVVTFSNTDLGDAPMPFERLVPGSLPVDVMPLGGLSVAQRVRGDDGDWMVQLRAFARYRRFESSPVELDVLVHQQDVGDVLGHAREFIGSRGDSRRIEGFQIAINPPVPGLGLEYMAHLENSGDGAWTAENQFVGSRGESRRLEGFAIRLTGPEANRYSVTYSAHVENEGDLPPAKDGAFIGTRGRSLRLEGMTVQVDRI